MKPVDWNKLSTFDDWSTTLNSLLDEARSAVAAKDAARMESVVEELVEFQEESPNLICRTLDQIADRAVRDVMGAAFTDAVSGIASRSAELAQYVKEMKAIVSNTKLEAASIRLDRARQLVQASTEVIQAATNLRLELKNNAGDKQVDQIIGEAIDAIQKLRNAVETSDHV